MKDKLIKLVLSKLDVGQIIDGLTVRRDSWRNTQKYLEGEDVDCEIEECSDADEAKAVADYYDYIIEKLKNQRDRQLAQKGNSALN